MFYLNTFHPLALLNTTEIVFCALNWEGGHHNQQVTLAHCYENRAPKQAFTGAGFYWFKKSKPFFKFLQGGFLATAKSLIHPPKLLLQYHEHGYQRKSLDLCGADESRRRITVMAKSEKKWKHQYALPGKGWLWGSFASKESFRSFFLFATVLDLFPRHLLAPSATSIFTSFEAFLCKTVRRCGSLKGLSRNQNLKVSKKRAKTSTL